MAKSPIIAARPRCTASECRRKTRPFRCRMAQIRGDSRAITNTHPRHAMGTFRTASIASPPVAPNNARLEGRQRPEISWATRAAKPIHNVPHTKPGRVWIMENRGTFSDTARWKGLDPGKNRANSSKGSRAPARGQGVTRHAKHIPPKIPPRRQRSGGLDQASGSITPRAVIGPSQESPCRFAISTWSPTARKAMGPRDLPGSASRSRHWRANTNRVATKGRASTDSRNNKTANAAANQPNGSKDRFLFQTRTTRAPARLTVLASVIAQGPPSFQSP